MNPSSSGWIKKLLKSIILDDITSKLSETEFYNALKSCGFIYGNNIKIVHALIEKNDFTDEEKSKTNLFIALYYTHKSITPNIDFINSIIDFYTEINATKKSFFQEILNEKKSSRQLEKIIHKRVQIDDNFLTKNFNYFVINALLFVDILAYQEYLYKKQISKTYIKNLEATIETIVLNVLSSKTNRTKYDESLIKLFEASLRYQDNFDITYNEAIQYLKTNQEKQYVLDIACMATWSDKTIEINEQHFLQKLSSDLKLDKTTQKRSIQMVNHFYTVYKDNIALLSSKNIIKSFYDNSNKMVRVLISRNRKRLYNELIDSKELMILLSKSTVRDLTKEEQKKVQEQLLDIFKSIPSLAIFLLPGGALLLPIFIKFIPKLLPSAFDDNRIEE
ncbi:TerB family tellurite resistance protein [Flavobacteriaceae bacterium AU392]|nr:TerB family tellurite resistance protein [Flavobacteriaceae bacterium]RKM83609.1 TerB family tellurite resistance protein [Flavobacteriaceae bacterium AU392]